MMGRRPDSIVALKSLLTTRVQGLAQLRVFSDVPKNDVVRQRVWDGSARRQSLVVAARAGLQHGGGSEAFKQRREAVSCAS